MFRRNKTIDMKTFLKRRYAREAKAEAKREKEIQKSIKKLEETKLVPGYTKIYC